MILPMVLDSPSSPSPPVNDVSPCEDPDEEEHEGQIITKSRRFPGDLFNLLPQEITSAIFCEVCSVDNAAKSTFEHMTLSPLRLTHVCSQWRGIAAETPRLWTRLEVTAKRADITSILELIKLWVPRCKMRPLVIVVHFNDEHGPFVIYPEDTLNLFRVITKTAALLRKDQCNDFNKTFFETHVKSESAGVLPILEERYLWYYGIDDAPSRDESSFVPLTVHGIRRAVDEFGIGFHEPLEKSLTRLELQDSNGVSCLSTTDLLAILAEFPHLRCVAAYIDHHDQPSVENFVATKLKVLTLEWSTTVDPGSIFDHLIAPNLEELELKGDLPAGGNWDHLLRFIERSDPPLRKIAVQHIDVTYQVSRFTDCLAKCKGLENLWIEDCVIDDSFITSLGRHNPKYNRSIISELRSLGLVSLNEISGECLAQTLRNAGISQLKELFIFDCEFISEDYCNLIRGEHPTIECFVEI